MQAVSRALECYFERRNRTHRVQSNESICAWECCQEFFLVEWGCVNCSTQGLACPPGQRCLECSERADAGCTACSGSRETSAIRMQRGLLQHQDTVRRGPLQALLGPHGARAARGPRAAVLRALCLQRDAPCALGTVSAGVGRSPRSNSAPSSGSRSPAQSTACRRGSARARAAAPPRTPASSATRSMGSGKSKTHGHAHSEKIHRETYTFRTSPY